MNSRYSFLYLPSGLNLMLVVIYALLYGCVAQEDDRQVIASLQAEDMLKEMPGYRMLPSLEHDLSGALESEGGRLMLTHCSNCHLPVPTTWLDRETWLEEVLPAMAPYLGIGRWGDHYYPVEDERDATGEAVYSRLSLSEWIQIVNYFDREAPDTLAFPITTTADTTLPGFTVIEPEIQMQRPVSTAMTAISPEGDTFFTSDLTSSSLTQWSWSEGLTPHPLLEQSGLTIVDLQFDSLTNHATEMVLVSIGSYLASDDNSGRLVRFDPDQNDLHLMADGLERPVCAISGDFTGNGREDWVICGFGHTTGGLYLQMQQKSGVYNCKTIFDKPGAIAIQVDDFTGNGHLDIMALFAQGDEGIWLFENDGTGHFKSRNLLRFPPVFGSNHFQVADFTGNGEPDILYVSGDNADFSSIRKPYHGLYIFANRGNFQYEQVWFHQMDGATKAIAADFTGNGLLDIAAIAYHAALDGPEANNFLFLERTGSDLQFSIYQPSLFQYGRWISMDAGDITGNGKLDLLLGNFNRPYSNRNQTGLNLNPYVPFVILANQHAQTTVRDTQ